MTWTLATTEITKVLEYFACFVGRHREVCDVNVEMSYTNVDQGEQIQVVLECPDCHNTIVGVVAESDLPAVINRLSPMPFKD